ncbi:MAG: undecaprenyl-phosphate glucose phosphotransferase [Pseudomonadota bacterium]
MSVLEQTSPVVRSKEEFQAAFRNEKLENNDSVELNALAKSVADQFAQGTVSPSVLGAGVALVELLGMFALSMILFVAAIEDASIYSMKAIGLSTIVSLMTVACATGLDAYLVPSLRQFANSASKAFTALVVTLTAVSLLIVVLYVTDAVPMNWIYAVFVTGALFQMGTRAVISQYVHDLVRSGRLMRRAVIIGGGEPAAELIKSLESNPDTDIKICGVFDDRGDDRSPSNVAGYPKLGTISELLAFARKARINMMIVSLPITAEKRVLQLMKRLWVLPVDIRLSAHANKLQFRPRSYSYEGSVPLVDIAHRPIADWDAIAKRTFDIVGSLVAIVLLSPIMLAAAIAVRLDSKGPIIFKQMREGFNNEAVEIYKFRSLYTNLEDKDGINMVTKGDSRVTRVGKIIRKTSIDELPQFFNVLQGRLSLVGPRPHVANAQTDNQLWSEVVDSYIARHKVKPGVTGWAQITGWRGEVDSQDKLHGRINADLYYIENWSLAFDLYILAMTPMRLLNTENAY